MLIESSMLLFLAGQSAAPQSKPPAPVLQVGVFSYGPDAAPQAAVYATSLDSVSFQYAAGCEIGGGNRPVPDRATDAWRVSGAVERITSEEAVVRVDWQRLRAGGVAVTSPGGSVELTLHPGDRVPLDSASPEPAAGCGGRTIGFEARFGPRPGWMIGPHGPLTESPAVTIMRGGGSGSSGRAGTGAGAGAGAGAGTGAGPGGGSVAISGSGRDVSSRALTADLWLVRADKSQPEKPDFNLQGLVLQKVRGTVPFAFTPFTIETPAGPIGVRITGWLQVTTEQGTAELVFTALRDVKYATGDTNRDLTRTGSSTTRNPMPGPDEVLSFELPPIRLPNGGAALPDQYSVRLRIR